MENTRPRITKYLQHNQYKTIFVSPLVICLNPRQLIRDAVTSLVSPILRFADFM